MKNNFKFFTRKEGRRLMAKNDDSLHFEMERNFRAETFIIQSQIFFLGLPGEHFKLYQFIIYLIGDKRDANPSVNQLARYMDKSRRQIFRYLDDLKELGLIKTQKRYTDEGVRTSNSFLLRDISTLEPLFTYDDLKREDFKISSMIKSRIERQKQKSSDNTSDTGDTIENPEFLSDQTGHQWHYCIFNSDTSDTIEDTIMPPVTRTPVAHRNITVGMDGWSVGENQIKEQNPNRVIQSEIIDGGQEVAAAYEEEINKEIDHSIVAVLDEHGVLNTETGKELYKIAIEEQATANELKQAFKEFFDYRKKQATMGNKVKSPIGFFVEKIRKYHKSDDILNTMDIPESIKEELEQKEKRRLTKPKAGTKKSKNTVTNKYDGFYL